MSISNEDKIEIRITLLKELQAIFGKPKPKNIGIVLPETELEKAQKNISDRLRNAEADKIALTNPEAAEIHRKIVPEF